MKQIVIVDDQSTTRLILSQVMSQIELPYPIKIELFESPIKAIEWVSTNDVDLIFVDYQMNTMNGQEFLKIFKSMPRFKKTPIIGMSTDNDISLKYQFLEDGAADFFTKPFDYHECMLRCRNLLNN